MLKSLSWSLFCSLQSRRSCRSCCCGLQAFFNLSTLFQSTRRPGRLSSRRSRGMDARRGDARNWKMASSHSRVSERERREGGKEREREREREINDFRQCVWARVSFFLSTILVTLGRFGTDCQQSFKLILIPIGKVQLVPPESSRTP